MILPQSTSEGAFKIAERVRAEMTKISFASNGSKFNVTVSCGVAQLDTSFMNHTDQLVEIADQALESFARRADSVQAVFELRGKAVKESEVGLGFQVRIVSLGEEQGGVNQVEVVTGLAEDHGERFFNQSLVYQGGQVLDAKGFFFKLPAPRLQLSDDRGAVTREALDDLGSWGPARVKLGGQVSNFLAITSRKDRGWDLLSYLEPSEFS